MKNPDINSGFILDDEGDTDIYDRGEDVNTFGLGESEDEEEDE